MMKSLGSIIQNNSFSVNMLRGVKAAQIVEGSEKVLAEFFENKFLNYASVAYYSNGVLCIACLSSAIAQEIKLCEKKLLLALAERVPGGLNIKRIRYLL